MAFRGAFAVLMHSIVALGSCQIYFWKLLSNRKRLFSFRISLEVKCAAQAEPFIKESPQINLITGNLNEDGGWNPRNDDGSSDRFLSMNLKPKWVKMKYFRQNSTQKARNKNKGWIRQKNCSFLFLKKLECRRVHARALDIPTKTFT